MILLPPLNLFFYNIVLGFVDCQYKKTMEGNVPNPESFWHKIPIINTFIDNPEPILPNADHVLPDLNPYVNALILLPAIFKHKYLKILVALVLMWNVVICKRLLIYFVRLLICLWSSDFGWMYFFAIFIFAVTMSVAHVLLMYYTAKLPFGQVMDWHRNR